MLKDIYMNKKNLIEFLRILLAKFKMNKTLKGNLEFVGPICESSDKFTNKKKLRNNLSKKKFIILKIMLFIQNMGLEK